MAAIVLNACTGEDNLQVFPAEVFLSAMALDDKRMLLATVRDISERKAYEEKLQQLAEANCPIAAIRKNGDYRSINGRYRV
jgi:hypothetical protein